MARTALESALSLYGHSGSGSGIGSGKGSGSGSGSGSGKEVRNKVKVTDINNDKVMDRNKDQDLDSSLPDTMSIIRKYIRVRVAKLVPHPISILFFSLN